MATVDDLVSMLSSTASDYSAGVSRSFDTLMSRAMLTHAEIEPPEPPEFELVDPGDVVDTYRTSAPNMGASSASRSVQKAMEPFVELLNGTPTSISELVSGLEGYVDKIEDRGDKIGVSESDFDPHKVSDTYMRDADGLLDAAGDWFRDYLDDYSPVTPRNIDRANDVLGDMLNGLGLPPTILENIWNQTRDQTIAEAQSLESQAYSDFAARGYAMPPGALNSTLQNIRYQRYGKTAAASRDIAIKQAEIIIDLQKFGVQTALSAYNDYINAILGFLRSYLTTALGAMSELYSQPLQQRIDYVLGMSRLLLQGSETHLGAIKAGPDVASSAGNVAALPYDVRAKLETLNNQFAGIEAELSRVDSELRKANLSARTQLLGMQYDYRTRMDATQLSSVWGFQTANVSAASSAIGGFARISATALAGLNAIQSDTKISF